MAGDWHWVFAWGALSAKLSAVALQLGLRSAWSDGDVSRLLMSFAIWQESPACSKQLSSNSTGLS